MPKIINLIKLDFQLLGTEIEPKKISEMLGIKPSTELARGERNAKLDLPRQNIWSLESQSASEEILDHWNDIKLKLQPSVEKIRVLAKTGTAKLTVVISGAVKRLPSIVIPADMSVFAGSVNATIDIDHLKS